MNLVVLMGRLTRDPEVRYSTGDSSLAIARYTLAVDRRFKRDNEQSADFIRCVVFGKSAEFAERYLHQGTRVVVNGRIQTGSYQNKEGVTVYTTEVVVENQEFAESKAVSEANRGTFTNYGNQPVRNNAPAQNSTPAPEVPDDGFMNIPEGIDEELPFN